MAYNFVNHQLNMNMHYTTQIRNIKEVIGTAHGNCIVFYMTFEMTTCFPRWFLK